MLSSQKIISMVINPKNKLIGPPVPLIEVNNLFHLIFSSPLAFESQLNHLKTGLPTTWSNGTNPQDLESCELPLLSHISQ